MTNEKEIKPIKLTLSPGVSVKISEADKENILQLTEVQKATLNQLGSTIKAYLKATEELLKEKYAGIKEMAPLHLSKPGNVLIICCEDGALIRYERKQEDTRVMVAWSLEKLSQPAPQISENVVFCHDDKNFASSVATNGAIVKFFILDPKTGLTQDIVESRIGFDVILSRPAKDASPSNKPYRLLSVRNSFDFHIHGELIPGHSSLGHGKRFLSRTVLNLPVGWEYIEIYPFLNLDYWNPEFAASWAENDLLASVVSQQFREQKFLELDPNVAARKHFSELFKTYKDLLDSNPEREETLQSFLKENPELLCPTRKKVWLKLSLGAKKTDFVFQEATGDYLLAEIERSTHRLFREDGDTSGELNHARNQIADWRRYLEDNLSTVQRELGLTGISANPKSLIVIGRSNSLTPENKRKLVTLENESPKTKIMNRIASVCLNCFMGLVKGKVRMVK
ncbi:DUF4263 domain-containing protein [candidate division KSB1 bacterium]|nr:DUF4263 domain-containing protein [candidate division KSB1 bacterium]